MKYEDFNKRIEPLTINIHSVVIFPGKEIMKIRYKGEYDIDIIKEFKQDDPSILCKFMIKVYPKDEKLEAWIKEKTGLVSLEYSNRDC